MKRYNTGLICGAFDVIHPGYIRLFMDAKNVCEKVVIALQTDPTVDRPEKDKPVQSVEDREMILRAIRFIDDVVLYTTESELLELTAQDFYDVRILGTDYKEKYFTGREHGKQIHWHSRDHDYSASGLKRSIKKAVTK